MLKYLNPGVVDDAETHHTLAFLRVLRRCNVLLVGKRNMPSIWLPFKNIFLRIDAHGLRRDFDSYCGLILSTCTYPDSPNYSILRATLDCTGRSNELEITRKILHLYWCKNHLLFILSRFLWFNVNFTSSCNKNVHEEVVLTWLLRGMLKTLEITSLSHL